MQMAKTRLCWVGVPEEIGGSGRDLSGVTCETVPSGRRGDPPNRTLQALANILRSQKDWLGQDRSCADQCPGHIWLPARPILPWFCR